ncbi:sigma-70 family RNA polymerase sigma factor [Vibrio crassostreae]|uniref:sigma-70 family RNA polymerase sigma factor n=1 Tax=Vibrio crassostreae TaxID=246167 RepID=UPI001B31255C|nr:sigma-70 family RNA polymerase sigma factor [Vibrio crassostreae]
MMVVERPVDKSEELLMYEQKPAVFFEKYKSRVYWCVEEVYRFGKDYHQREDLKSIATIGLFEAVLKFDHSRGVKFKTYATEVILGTLVDNLSQSNSPVKWDKTIAQLYRTFEKFELAGKGSIDDFITERSLTRLTATNLKWFIGIKKNQYYSEDIEEPLTHQKVYKFEEPERNISDSQLNGYIKDSLQYLSADHQLVAEAFVKSVEEDTPLNQVLKAQNTSNNLSDATMYRLKTEVKNHIRGYLESKNITSDILFNER